VLGNQNYDPYGSPEGGAQPPTFGYTGELQDGSTNALYLRARWYQPGTGTLLGADPMLDTTGQAYSYAGNNPVFALDPTGAFPCDLINNFGHCMNDFGSEADHARAALGAFKDEHFGPEITAINSTDFSNTVYDGSWGVVAQAANASVQCGENAAVCAARIGGWSLDNLTHPWQFPVGVVKGAWQTGTSVLTELQCGQYGKVGGTVLLTFVYTVGGGKLIGVVGDAGPISGKLATGEDVGGVHPGEEPPSAKPRDPSASPCGCFPGQTMVVTPHGSQAIATIKVGELVLAEDPITGKIASEPVLALIDDGIKPLMAVGFSDQSSLRVTTNHPFYVDSSSVRDQAGWVEAGDLRLGDQVRTAGGHDLTVTSLRYHVGAAHVYTLTVAADHDFFVGSAGVLVHNCKLPSLRITDAQFGAKVAKHARDYGLDPSDPAARSWLRQKIENIVANADDIRQGDWHPNGGGGADYLFWRQGADVVVTESDGTFVTILKDGQTNGWYNRATKVGP